MTRTDAPCFHCGEPVPQDSAYRLDHGEQALPLCCAGCLAVAELIFTSGLERYYQFRQAMSRKAGDDVERERLAWQACDARESLWGQAMPNGRRETLLQTEGIHCAACAWLIRSQLLKISGVERIDVDISSGYTTVLWKPGDCRLSEIAMALFELGYKPHLPIAGEQERARQDERKKSLRRVGIAGLGMMQVMMYAVALYAGDAQGIDTLPERFLEWVSLLVTTPVLLYSGRVFFQGAWQGLKAKRPGMDVPVALAIGIAYTASCINFFSGNGEVWFDSVVMFIFFLLMGRHVEMSLRHRNQQSGAVLARLLPEWAERVTPAGTETVLTTVLTGGDHVRVRVGESFPADGHLLEGATEVNEALLTGESYPRPRTPGDKVIAGSINLLQPVLFEVTAAGMDSTVSALGRLLEKARASRGRTAVLAESIAIWFVLAVLLFAAAAGTWWWFRDPDMVVPVALSVLVVSCPCALSLAAPSTVAAASRALLKRGIILTRASALETLTTINRVLFDKTGTLTSGRPRVAAVRLNPERSGGDEQRLLAIAAALEISSAHPLAHAFRPFDAQLSASEVEVTSGQGIEGIVAESRFRIGSAQFAGPETMAPEATDSGVWLADETGWLAVFSISDSLRTGAADSTRYFFAAGIPSTILSGDHPLAVESVAGELGIEDWHAGLSPKDKLAHLQQFAARKERILMVGDGVNDAPVLAAADVSVAVQGGTELANSAADFILTGRTLDGVRQAREISLAARRIITQNMAWAVTYNLTMIPLAFSGMLKPWMAAIGMSASSLIVVLNAARLGREGAADADPPTTE